MNSESERDLLEMVTDEGTSIVPAEPVKNLPITIEAGKTYYNRKMEAVLVLYAITDDNYDFKTDKGYYVTAAGKYAPKDSTIDSPQDLIEEVQPEATIAEDTEPNKTLAPEVSTPVPTELPRAALGPVVGETYRTPGGRSVYIAYKLEDGRFIGELTDKVGAKHLVYVEKDGSYVLGALS